MVSRLWGSIFLLSSLLVILPAPIAHAIPANTSLNSRELSAAEYERVQAVVNTKVKEDLSSHFEARVNAISNNHAVDPPLTPSARAILVDGAYQALKRLSKLPVDESTFNQNVNRALDWFAAHHLSPSAICLEVQGRKTLGEGYTAGVNAGAEMNFYLEDGKLMMTNYSLLGGQVGAGTPVSDIEYSVSFCFGSCSGGNPTGWYLGVDGDVADGLGVGLFAEVEVDVSQVAESEAADHEISASDLYDATTFYIGFCFTQGIGGETALGLYRYSQIGNDTVLAEPGQVIRPSMISNQASNLKPW